LMALDAIGEETNTLGNRIRVAREPWARPTYESCFDLA
jgi:hypothetical protein